LVKKSNQKVAEMNTNDPGKKSYDILPGVGEIVLWAAKDKRGYLIDINGSWAKIDGQRWIRENMAVLHNTYKKASMAYRFVSNFKEFLFFNNITIFIRYSVNLAFLKNQRKNI